MDDILKAYGQPRATDVLTDVLLFDPELGLNPYTWTSRRLYEECLQNPQIQAAYNRYHELHDAVYQKWTERYTEDFMKGQAFGL